MDFLKTTTGVPSGMEYGTLRSLNALKRKYTDIIVCLDNGKEKKDHEFYKANRPKRSPEFYKRLKQITGVVKELYSFSERVDTEADTIMHALSLQYNNVFLYTNDKDLHQSITDTVLQIKSHNSKEFIWGPEEVWEKYKVRPDQWALYRSFTGDPSDNIPKCKGFGPTYAAELVREAFHADPGNPCAGLIAVLDKANLSVKQRRTWTIFQQQLYINYSLIKIPNIKAAVCEAFGGDISEFLTKYEMNTLTTDETEF